MFMTWCRVGRVGSGPRTTQISGSCRFTLFLGRVGTGRVAKFGPACNSGMDGMDGRMFTWIFPGGDLHP